MSEPLWATVPALNSIPSCLSSSYLFPSFQPSLFGVWVQRSSAGSAKLFLCLLEFQLTSQASFCSVSMFFSLSFNAPSWSPLPQSHVPERFWQTNFPNKTNSVLLKPRIFILLFVFLPSLGVLILRSWTLEGQGCPLPEHCLFFLPSLFMSNKSGTKKNVLDDPQKLVGLLLPHWVLLQIAEQFCIPKQAVLTIVSSL